MTEGSEDAQQIEIRRLRHLLQHAFDGIVSMHAYLKCTPEEQAQANFVNILAMWNEAFDMLRAELWHPHSPAVEFHAQIHPHVAPHDDHDRSHDAALFERVLGPDYGEADG